MDVGIVKDFIRSDSENMNRDMDNFCNFSKKKISISRISGYCGLQNANNSERRDKKNMKK